MKNKKEKGKNTPAIYIVGGILAVALLVFFSLKTLAHYEMKWEKKYISHPTFSVDYSNKNGCQVQVRKDGKGVRTLASVPDLGTEGPIQTIEIVKDKFGAVHKTVRNQRWIKQGEYLSPVITGEEEYDTFGSWCRSSAVHGLPGEVKALFFGYYNLE